MRRCGSSLFELAAKSLTFQAVCSYYSSHGRDQIATLRGMAGLHHRSLKAHLICLDSPVRRKKFPVISLLNRDEPAETSSLGTHSTATQATRSETSRKDPRSDPEKPANSRGVDG